MSSASSSSGGPPLPLPPLVLESGTASGTLSLRVDKSFRLQSTNSTSWQWTKWYDLGSGSANNLASTPPMIDGINIDRLLEPQYFYDGNTWNDTEGAPVKSVAIVDETPARVMVDAVVSIPPAGTELHSAYTVYASGRVASFITTTNVGSTTLNFSMSESNYVSVNGHLTNGSLTWTKTSYMSVSGGFLRQDGPSPRSSLLMINTQKQTDLNADSMNLNWYWGEGPSVMLAPGQSYVSSGELQLGPGDQTQITHGSRTDDVLNPGLTVQSGGMPTGTGWDVGRSAYTITANSGATSVVFGPTTDHTRYWPAFVVTGFSAPKWHVTLGGQEIVSSTALDGVGALASSANNEIVIVLGSTIQEGALDAARLLTLEAQ